jgi:hypothetical protein
MFAMILSASNDFWEVYRLIYTDKDDCPWLRSAPAQWRTVLLLLLLLWLYSPLIGLGLFLSFPIKHRFSRTPWTGDEPAARPLLHTGQQNQNKCTQTSMPRVGLKPTTPVFERANIVPALDCSNTVMGTMMKTTCIYITGTTSVMSCFLLC